MCIFVAPALHCTYITKGYTFSFDQEVPASQTHMAQTYTLSGAAQYKQPRQDLVYLTSRSTCLVKYGIKVTDVFDQTVLFPWGPAVSFPIKIKYDCRRHACKLKLYFPPRVHTLVKHTVCRRLCICTSFYEAARCLVFSGRLYFHCLHSSSILP